jgi:ABC-type transport system involved in multi-copper enzyme maturation permease subunit
MWQEFFRFDLRYQLRQPLLWLTAIALSAMAFLSASNDSFRIGGGIGNVHMNAPVVIANQLSILSIIAMFLVTVFIAGAVLRDKEVGIADMLFATPMRKLEYLFGRFFAGFVACLAIFGLITLAMMLGASMPSIDPARLGAFSVHTYAWSFFVLVVPNLLFVAALLMMLAATTRSMILVYVGVLAFMVLWSVAGALGSEGGNASMAVLLDPFGVRALKQATRYYTSAESNSSLPPLSGLLLMNRLLWTAIAMGMFAATVILFKPQRIGSGRAWFGAARKPLAATAAPAVTAARRIAPRFSASTAWSQWWAVLCFDAKGVIKSMPFLVMLLLAIANFVANFTVNGMRFDSAPYPLTRLLLEELAGGINAVLVIVLIFYSGELIFKEKQVKISDVSDAMPVPNWVPLMAKAAALVAVIFAFLFAGVGAALIIQLAKGGAPVEGMLYLQGTLINAVYFILMAMAVLSLQTITNNKFIGYGLAIALFLANTVLNGMDFNHKLYSFSALPTLTYSDVNGYGHFLTGWSWFALYWSLFCVALLIVAQAFWQRGLALGGLARLAAAMRNLRGKAGMALALSLVAFGVTGAWIFYNTNVLNRYESADQVLDAQADYEKLYRKTLALPQPSLTNVRANVDIYPAERRVNIKGHYVLKNKTAAPIDQLRVQTDVTATTTIDQLPAHTVISDDKRFGFKVLQLATPLAPGATLAFDFTVAVINPGFTNSGAPDTVNNNGTMFTSENFFPTLGYVQAREIDDRGERRKRGLGEPHRMPKLEDQQARYSNFWKLFGFDADLIDFETTVSTSAGQLAVAPGQLEKRWEKDGRSYFQYKMDKPILPFFSYQSGTWEVKKANWRGVPIEVYYDKKHAYNIDSMIKGTQGALDYNTDNFGPYPHKQVRILETPLYQTFARSFPGTIPFSESLGFISDMRDPEGVDHVFYVTAHEMAHQWWGDQIIAANVQGSAMITESLAEYSALMALEKRYGADKVRHILRWDMDQYLAGRGKELVEELPLIRTESQIYLHYRKGSLAFYRLREEIGEVALNRALRKFLDANRYQSTPYVTSLDLLKFIRAEAGQDKQALITDLFERIVIYDNRVLESTMRQRADGKWDVTLKLNLAKLQADGKGKESARAYDEPVDIAIFARAAGGREKDERVLHRAKYALPAGESTLTVTVDEKPYEAGVDPYNLLIDRVAADNRKKIAIAGAAL